MRDHDEAVVSGRRNRDARDRRDGAEVSDWPRRVAAPALIVALVFSLTACRDHGFGSGPSDTQPPTVRTVTVAGPAIQPPAPVPTHTPPPTATASSPDGQSDINAGKGPTGPDVSGGDAARRHFDQVD
jgi:hypothetical protein